MANKKISQLTLAGDVIYPIDLMELSRDDGAGNYTSEAISGDQLYGGMMVATPYISAYSATNQTFTALVPTSIAFDAVAFSNFINLPTAYNVETEKGGYYQMDFTATIKNNGSNANNYIGFYLKINGSAVDDSSKFMNAPTNHHHISFQTSWLVEMKALDVVSIVCVMEKVTFELITESAFTGVLTPSVQLIMKRIG